MATRSDFAPGSAAFLLLPALAENWWMFLLRGIAAIAFGLLSLFWPVLTLLALVLMYGAYAFVDGVFAIVAAARGRGGPMPRWWLALVGALGVFAGLATFFWPDITALVLIAIIGAWALVSGVFEIVGAIRLRKEIDNEWLLILHGVLGVLFGLFVLVQPGAGGLALVWVIGGFALVSGLLLVSFAFRLKKHARAA